MLAPIPSDRVSGLRPTAVNSILGEVRQAQSQGRTLVSLMRGEPDFRTPGHVILAADRALRSGRTSYPDNRGETALREAIALKLQRENGVSYDPGSEILVTTGATFGIHAALMAVLNPGDEVLLPDPVYDAYHSPILLAGGAVRSVPAAIRDGRFTFGAAELDAVITPRCRALLLNNPWNPTGTVFTRDELDVIGEFVLKHQLILLSDEIYEAITYPGHKQISPASLSPELRERTILINSFSKTYAMTGWRVGYNAASPLLTQAMFLVLQQSSRGPSTFVQDAANEALRESQDCVEEMRTEYIRRRALVIDGLNGIEGCTVLAPEGGFFAMLDIRELGMPSIDVRRRLMEDAGVVVVHGSAYGPSGEGTLRVSFASGGDVLERGLERLRAGLIALKAAGA
jgi:aspartate/methionine/tyrosine aminotransferase